MLAGARRGELAALQWSDVDFRWGSLSIRDKVEGERVIPLTSYVAFLIESHREEWTLSGAAFTTPEGANNRRDRRVDPARLEAVIRDIFGVGRSARRYRRTNPRTTVPY